MNKDMETRTFLGPVESRASEDGNEINIVGQPIVFDQWTDIGGLWRERIAPGAVSEENLRDVRLLVNHDFSGIPLARSRRNTANSTMQSTIGDLAVDMKARLDSKNPRALEADSAIKRGDISGMSFAFLVGEDKWEDLDTDYPSRTITKFSNIFEYSLCTFPAYEGTSLASRSMEIGQRSLAEARAALDSARKRAEQIAGLNQRLKEINHE